MDSGACTSEVGVCRRMTSGNGVDSQSGGPVAEARMVTAGQCWRPLVHHSGKRRTLSMMGFAAAANALEYADW